MTREPLVLLHGFMDSRRSWDLVLPALERVHEVLVPALPGHAGGPALAGAVDERLMPDAIERAMDEAGFETAHLAGNSLGGFIALQLAARGRARSVVALAPAGGSDMQPVLERQRALHAGSCSAAAFADSIAATPEGRRRATELLTVRCEHLPPELVAELVAAVARCDAQPLLDYAASAEWPLDFERIDRPVRIIWGAADRLLPWPSAAERYRSSLPNADWVVLDDVGHVPQLDVPLETAQLILGVTAR